MNNVSVAEMLRLKGKWTESKEFVSFLAEKLHISERMAYIKIKKAVASSDILKVHLSDTKRTVLYGLPEFGRHGIAQLAIGRPVWQEHAPQEFIRIMKMINSPNDEVIARVPEDTLLCIETLLPSEFKEKLKPEITELKRRLANIYKSTTVNRLSPTAIMRSRTLRRRMLVVVADKFVRQRILKKVFALLYGEEQLENSP
jgi:hypothetical protein